MDEIHLECSGPADDEHRDAAGEPGQAREPRHVPCTVRPVTGGELFLALTVSTSGLQAPLFTLAAGLLAAAVALLVANRTVRDSRADRLQAACVEAVTASHVVRLSLHALSSRRTDERRAEVAHALAAFEAATDLLAVASVSASRSEGHEDRAARLARRRKTRHFQVPVLEIYVPTGVTGTGTPPDPQQWLTDLTGAPVRSSDAFPSPTDVGDLSQEWAERMVRIVRGRELAAEILRAKEASSSSPSAPGEVTAETRPLSTANLAEDLLDCGRLWQRSILGTHLRAGDDRRPWESDGCYGLYEPRLLSDAPRDAPDSLVPSDREGERKRKHDAESAFIAFQELLLHSVELAIRDARLAHIARVPTGLGLVSAGLVVTAVIVGSASGNSAAERTMRLDTAAISALEQSRAGVEGCQRGGQSLMQCLGNMSAVDGRNIRHHVSQRSYVLAVTSSSGNVFRITTGPTRPDLRSCTARNKHDGACDGDRW